MRIIRLLSFALSVLAAACTKHPSESGTTEIPQLSWTVGSDWLNVKTAGVIGDGKTDDTEALQKVLTNLQEGEALYFPPGTYRITHELIINKKVTPDTKEKRLMGNAFYGHGPASIIKYDGQEGGTILRIHGMLHYRMIGLVFDGGGKAAIGMFHDNLFEGEMRFETHLFHEFITMRNFTKYGLYFGFFGERTNVASAETVFSHMIFENCNTGIGLTNFNDYNFTFDGCIFRDNAQMGIECQNGNFYVRNSRFERNKLDVWANPEHSSSIRRSVSVGSGAFLDFRNSISPFTIENCLVQNWKDDQAITSLGAPLIIFDNQFQSSTPKPHAIRAKGDQPIILAGNTISGVEKLIAKETSRTVTVDLPSPSPLKLTGKEDFMPRKVVLPGQHFDVKSDFGAKGDGKADDTEAIQNAINAAQKHGNNAIAYLPKGTYRITRTLDISGKDYFVGGSGNHCILEFDGDPDADAVHVRPEGNLTLDAFKVKRAKFTVTRVVMPDREDSSKNARLTDFEGKGGDIVQFPSSNGSRVTYHTVYVSGKYIEMPFLLGLRLSGLAKHDTVILDNIEGNLHILDSGDATILHKVGYEGTLWVKGLPRDGFLGIMTRLATDCEYSLYIEDSQSLVASDFYVEQGPPDSILFKGSPEGPSGRMTLGFVKVDRFLNFDNYRGEINLVATQFYRRTHSTLGINITGEPPAISLFGSYFYIKNFQTNPLTTSINLVATTGKSEFNAAEISASEVSEPQRFINAVIDLRKLGVTDWSLNYPDLLKQ